MATPTLANLPLEIPRQIRTDEERREQNARMLHELWALGEKMAVQAIEVRVKPDPLTIALNGFPDVNTSRAYYEGSR